MSRIISAILLLIVGAGILASGFLMNTYLVSNDSLNTNTAKNNSPVLPLKVVSSINFAGKVSAINGNSIEITQEGETAKITLRDDVRILKPSATQGYITGTIADVKVSNTVNVSTAILSNNTFEGVSLIITSVK